MDKIQAAIAKARADRDAAGGQAQARRIVSRVLEKGEQTHPSQLVKVDRETIWNSLASFKPAPQQMARQRVVTFGNQNQSNPEAIAFGKLRTKVLQQMRMNGWRRLAITSPGGGCGKSTVVLNLAFAMARQPELHTIVAEIDMRRPSLAKTLGLQGDTSFSDVMNGKADFGDIAVCPRQNLAFALNYSRTENASELLQSPAIVPVLSQIESRYDPDLTIFDLPPMLESDDTMGFLDQVDCVLLVAAAGETSLREIDVCEQELSAQTNVLGVVLNKCRYVDDDFN
jgi:Mrp family chromosome partitioning ATPase